MFIPCASVRVMVIVGRVGTGFCPVLSGVQDAFCAFRGVEQQRFAVDAGNGSVEKIFHAIDDNHVGFCQFAHILRSECVIVRTADRGREHPGDFEAGYILHDGVCQCGDRKSGAENVCFRSERKCQAGQQGGKRSGGSSHIISPFTSGSQRFSTVR